MFPFAIVRMPFLCSNIPRNIFYSALVGEFLSIARTNLNLSDFELKSKDLLKKMLNQGGDYEVIRKKPLKIVRNRPDSFSQFHQSPENLIQICFLNVISS